MGQDCRAGLKLCWKLSLCHVVSERWFVLFWKLLVWCLNAIRHGDNLRKTYLENVLSPIDKNKDQFINDRFVYAVEMTKRSVGWYVDLVAYVSHKMQVLEDEIVFLKRVVANVPRWWLIQTKIAGVKVIWWCEKF